jgi:Holliday junction resolvase
MNTRQIGRKLESFVADYLKEIDSTARPTKNSGASNQIADILNLYFYIECKKRNTENITIKSKTWRKLCNEIPVGSTKIPLYINSNVHNETFVSLDIKDFINILKQIYK